MSHPPTRSRAAWLALLASVLLHGGVYWWSTQAKPVATPTQREERIEVTMRSVVRPKPQPEPQPEPEPEPEPVAPPRPPAVRKRPEPARPITPPEPTPPPAAPIEPPPAPAEEPKDDVAIVPPSPPTPPPADDAMGLLFRKDKGAPGGTAPSGTGGLLLGKDGAARLALQAQPAEKEDPKRAAGLEQQGWKYQDFFARVKELVHRAWRPDAALRNHVDSNELKGVRSGRTVVEVTLDRVGRVVNTRVAQAGAAPFLDEEAERAASRAAPFPNPPRGLFDDDGLFRFNLGFDVTVHMPTAMRRLLQSHGNAAEALISALSPSRGSVDWCIKRVEKCGRGCVEEYPVLALVAEPCAVGKK